jgi:hypothetical protein
MLDADTIRNLEARLWTHRQTLAHLLQQLAQYGGEGYAPPVVVNSIAENRESIKQIKKTLRANDVHLEDQPDDDVQGYRPGEKVEMNKPTVAPSPSGVRGELMLTSQDHHYLCSFNQG